MTGWRLGYVCAPPAIDEAMFKIHQYGIMCAPIMSQHAAIEALKVELECDLNEPEKSPNKDVDTLQENIVKIKVLPYHDYAASKYQALGMKNYMLK